MRASVVIVGKRGSASSISARRSEGYDSESTIRLVDSYRDLGLQEDFPDSRSSVAGNYGGAINGRAPSFKPVGSRYAHLGEPPTFRIDVAESVGQEIWTEDAHYLLTPARSAIILKLPDEVWRNISGMVGLDAFFFPEDI